ncbi:hypothetical protein ACGF8B_31210 [Streptomyces sp. NPDC047917]|uniref:hypothetical protein n=1 Tax=Streptomyces sp. NPDC047917 TaxID=3365491 RepID=UPI00371B388D
MELADAPARAGDTAVGSVIDGISTSRTLILCDRSCTKRTSAYSAPVTRTTPDVGAEREHESAMADAVFTGERTRLFTQTTRPPVEGAARSHPDRCRVFTRWGDQRCGQGSPQVFIRGAFRPGTARLFADAPPYGRPGAAQH